MAGANAERGELDLQLAGVSYRLRPSHGAILAIEKATGFALVELVRLGNSQALPMTAVGAIGAELIRAGAEADSMDRHVHADRIGELIFEEGIVGVTARLTLALSEAASGGRAASGEAKAATAAT